MSLTWIANRSINVSPRVRLVADEDAEALRRKREALAGRPEGGFLRDQPVERPRLATPRATPAG